MDLLVLLLLAGVAVLVLAKLYSVLGRDVGAPVPPTVPKQVSAIEPRSEKTHAGKTHASFAGQEQIEAKDPGFDPDTFLQGASTAYEIVVGAFANGDRKTLENMLEEQVYDNYDQAIKERESKGLQVQIDIVRMIEARLVEAKVENKTSYVTVEFHTDLSVIQKDENGEIVDEENSGLAETVEQWTFSKPLHSRDPNWRLSAVAAIA